MWHLGMLPLRQPRELGQALAWIYQNDKPYRSKQIQIKTTHGTSRVNNTQVVCNWEGMLSPLGCVSHQTLNLKTLGNYMRNLMLEEMTRPAIDPEAQKLALKLILTEKVAPDYEELLTNLLVAIAKDRDAIRIMATKQAMAQAVAAMKHLWD